MITMNGRDPHRALTREILAQESSNTANIVLAKLQWSKEDVAYSLHIEPRTHSLSGIQVTDFLSFLGFRRSRCSFVGRGDCYVRWVGEDFDTTTFPESFDTSYSNLTDALKDLEACGVIKDQPEGWGYFSGVMSESIRYNDQISGDGHMASHVQSMKETESKDDVFLYKFTFLRNGYEKGWVIHCRPKRPPLSPELQSAFTFLKLREFQNCPEYDFEPCYWYPFPFIERGRGLNNAREANRCFDAHAQRFSPGIQKLLVANAEIKKSGFTFLPVQESEHDIEHDINMERVTTQSLPTPSENISFDVVLSFAGADREHAEKLKTILKDQGFRIFYDHDHKEDLWGKNLPDYFSKIYESSARFCVIFVSQAYKDGFWTNHERKSAIARYIRENEEYILPIKVEDVELDGIPPTIGYVELEMGIDKIAELLIKKLLK